jgi:tight adherence protein B
MGLSMDSAMRALTYRAPLPEVRILAATLTVQRHAGGNLPITLERLVRVIRDRISYRRQFRATTAAGRISTIMIALAGPLVFAYLFIWQRDYLREFLELPQGQMLLVLAIVLQVIGLLWIYRLLSTDY